MENLHFQSIDQVDDISTIDEYHVAKNAGLNEKEALSCISRYSRDNAVHRFSGTTAPMPDLPVEIHGFRSTRIIKRSM